MLPCPGQVPHPEPSSLLPPHTIPLGRPSARSCRWGLEGLPHVQGAVVAQAQAGRFISEPLGKPYIKLKKTKKKDLFLFDSGSKQGSCTAIGLYVSLILWALSSSLSLLFPPCLFLIKNLRLLTYSLNLPDCPACWCLASRARRLEAGERWARLAQARAASRPGSALSRLGAELELRRSGSSLGPSQ